MTGSGATGPAATGRPAAPAIGVLVVDDDFRVADLHARFVSQVPGFAVVGIAHTAAEALERAQRRRPDLALLDLYLPDRSGADLVGELGCDVIMLTAAADAATVRRVVGRGVVNYLVKPFSADDLTERLRAYARYRTYLSGQRDLDQVDIDRANRLLHEGDRTDAGVRKGRSSHTAGLIVDAVRGAAEPVSAADIAAQLGLSRATAQRYLADLVADGRVRMSLRYGATGRPEHQYDWRGRHGGAPADPPR